MMDGQKDALDELVNLVKASAKYQSIAAELIREIGRKELAKRRSLKEAVKETRNKLHQIGSSYQERLIPYTEWLKELQELPHDLQDERVRQALVNDMRMHASTAERLSILERFFRETLAELAPVTSILDLACGLTPLSLPWMPIAQGMEYTACDIYEDMTAFLGEYFRHFGIQGSTFTCDLTCEAPQTAARVALLLKTIPCLDQVDKSAAGRLLRGLQTDYILASFPARSLGGRGKGMRENYETRFNELVSGENWKITRFDYVSELAFLIRK
jgi:16S rRNA (guanine(1405)-N(7))-methyltransferase